jgi:hypothetical protein
MGLELRIGNLLGVSDWLQQQEDAKEQQVANGHGV